MNRPWQITNEQEWEELRRDIVECARGILNGSVGLTEGSRSLSALRQTVRAESDADFRVFIAIMSETDRFPVGDVRELWNPDALAHYDAERLAEERRWRLEAEVACKNILAKFENA